MGDGQAIWIAMGVSLLVSGLGAPLIFALLKRIKSRQTISEHVGEHAEKQGTPTMGGFIMLAGLGAGVIATWQPEFLPIAVLIIAYALVGFLDDFLIPRMIEGSRGLHWAPKLGLEIGAVAVAVAMSGEADPLKIGAAVFLVLFWSNAFNFSDGMDGLAGGLGFVLCFGFVFLGSQFVHYGERYQFSFVEGADRYMGVIDVALVALAVSFLPFLLLNAHPAKLFMGDVGSLPIGALFGWASFTFLSAAPSWLTLVVVMVLGLVMLVEIVPPPLQILSAKLRKGKRLFPFATPVHHGMQQAGVPETRVVAIFVISQIICALGAVAIMRFGVWGSA